MELIELKSIYKNYQMGEIILPVLRGVSLTISRGDFVALMGASGSGKTTLMNILGCLDRPTSGRYWFDGHDVVELSPEERALLRNQKIGFVFQNFNLLPRTSALENVMMPLNYTTNRISDREARKRARKLLERVGLGEHLNHEPSQLSGGEQQRVAIARALINHPSLLFADEPTGNLDSRTSDEVLRLFEQLNKEEGVTIVLVTHDPNVARYAQKIIRIRDGVIETDPAVPLDTETDSFPQPNQERLNPGKRARGWTVSQFRRMLTIALTSLRRNVLRAGLTALGIVIGVGAVIAMMEIGSGSSNAIQKSIATMGANNLMVNPGTASSGGVSFGAGSVMTLTPQDSDAIQKECPAVRVSAPLVHARTQIIYGGRNWVPTFIEGSTPAYLDVREWSLAEGEVFTDRDVSNVNKVCLLGETLARELFQGESPRLDHPQAV
jgi:macrolide transport system ATP-binding/permease protein